MIILQLLLLLFFLLLFFYRKLLLGIIFIDIISEMYFRICEISSRVKFCETILSIFAGLQHDDITFSNYLQTNTSKKTKLKINSLPKQDFVRSLHIEY